MTPASRDRYLTPLPRMLAGAVEHGLNRLLALDPNTPAQLESLGDKRLQVTLEQLNIDLFFHAAGEALNVSATATQAADTTLSGTPLALLSMLAPERGGRPTPGGTVRISGDAELARRFERLVRRLDPDWEAVLSDYFGDLIGHQVYAFLHQGREGIRHTAATGTAQMGAWLGEESGLLINRTEFEAFSRDVDTLREAVDRLEQRKL